MKHLTVTKIRIAILKGLRILYKRNLKARDTFYLAWRLSHDNSMLLCQRDLNAYVYPTAHMILLPLNHKWWWEIGPAEEQQVQHSKKLPKIHICSTESGRIFTDIKCAWSNTHQQVTCRLQTPIHPALDKQYSVFDFREIKQWCVRDTVASKLINAFEDTTFPCSKLVLPSMLWEKSHRSSFPS